MRMSDWSSDVCSSDLTGDRADKHAGRGKAREGSHLGNCVPTAGMSDAQFGITEEPLCQCFGAWHRAIGSETQHGGTEILERILIDGVQLRDDVFPMNDYGDRKCTRLNSSQ